MKANYIKTNKLFSITKYSVFALALSSLVVSCGKSKTDYDAAGTFETTEVIVSSEASGKILSLDLKEGQILTLNQTVGAIDSVQLYLRKLQLQANGRAVQSRRPDINKQVAALGQQIITAKTERKRAENLVKANAANQKQLDDINAQIALLEKQLDAQKTTLTTSIQGITNENEGVNIQIAQVEDQLRKCRITSPIGGTVLVKYTEAGEIAAPGKALFKIADTENMILRAYITADQLTKVKVGQKVKISSDYGKNDTKIYPGTITWISSKSEFTPKTIQTRDERANLVYAVKISVKNDGYLKIGMYGSIKLTVDN